MRHQPRMFAALAAALIAAAGLVATTAAQEFPPGFVDPEPILRAAREAIGTGQPPLHHHRRYRRLRRHGGPAATPWLRSGLAADRSPPELCPDDELGCRHPDRGIRPRTRAGSGVMALGPRLARRHADSAGEPPALLHQRDARLVTRRHERRGGRRASGGRRTLAARHVDQPARLSEGGAATGRQPARHLAVGAGRDGA